jgi:hypothetical protein
MHRDLITFLTHYSDFNKINLYKMKTYLNNNYKLRVTSYEQKELIIDNGQWTIKKSNFQLFLRAFALSAFCLLLLIGCDREFDTPPINAPFYGKDSTISIKNFKAKYDTNLIEIEEDDIIMGYVIANDISGNLYKQIFIDDGEEGLCVAINQNNLYNEYRIGQQVYIETKGLYMGKYGGLPQLGYRYSSNNDGNYAIGQAPELIFKEKAFKHGFPDRSKVKSDTITFNDFRPELLGRLVTFKSVEFEDAKDIFSRPDGGRVQTLNRIIRSSENPNHNVTARMSSAANFAAHKIPSGIGNVTGVLTIFNNTNQILVRDSLDINFEPNPDGWGTKNDPWSVEYTINNQDRNISGWVKGVIVGSLKPGINDDNPITKNDDIIFGDAAHVIYGYIVIAENADVRDWTKCVVVNLPAGSPMFEALNLIDNKENIGKEVKVLGRLEKTLGAAGVKVANGTTSEFEIGTTEPVDPDGDGSKENPYNITAAIKNQNTTGKWVKGYIVGAVDKGDGTGINISTDSRFTPPFSVASNILIAATPHETDYTKCIPVQLVAQTDPRTKLNLVNNPGNLGKEVMVFGDLSAYFNVPGIRSVSDCEIDGEGPPPDPDHIFLETFGTGTYSATRPKIDDFDDFDNKDVTFTDPTGNADVRSTGAMNAHVWFPANKESKLIIEGINISGYKNVKLSYDFTHNAETGQITADKLIVKINGKEQTVPATSVTRNVFSNITITQVITESGPVTIEFHATVANNPEGVGFRLDNIMLTGEKN